LPKVVQNQWIWPQPAFKSLGRCAAGFEIVYHKHISGLENFDRLAPASFQRVSVQLEKSVIQ
jgi:hypothetical protein